MLSHKLLGSGLGALSVQAMGLDVASGLTATGTTQSDAYALTAEKSAFTTVASGSGAVLYASAAPGDSQLVYNGGANPLRVYPPSAAAFNGQAVNIPHLLNINSACEFHCLTSTLWTGILSQ